MRVGRDDTGKGRRMIKDVNAFLSEAEHITLMFSAGRLWNVQRRWNLKSDKMNGEAAESNNRAIEEALPHLY